ncbi:hypothetical protein [Oceanibacterium hippocampi]|uniref:Uncharacterized protein n=1 Tax=Oceanibacterium hippocampi TaxID=745714 RepID=A0A1Y5TCV2_9PROT|nr:hypothetical protein [Oceanibacterium hippocampi]SLN58930.1 hypothetical protein OCH7691_02596 [Oceanibacterium hippocampi]
MNIGTASAAALLMLITGPAWAEGVVVHRGGQSPEVVNAEKIQGVMVQRGTPVVHRARVEAPASSGLQAVAGKRVWLVDRKRGLLQVCEQLRTDRLGERELRCDWRTLP